MTQETSAATTTANYFFTLSLQHGGFTGINARIKANKAKMDNLQREIDDLVSARNYCLNHAAEADAFKTEFEEKAAIVGSDNVSLKFGDKVDVSTNKGGWRGKGIFHRFEGELAVVKRPNGDIDKFHSTRVRYARA